MKWIATWRSIDISNGIKKATYTGDIQQATIIFDSPWYRYWSGNPSRKGYISGSNLSLQAAQKSLREQCCIKPYTRFVKTT